MPQFERVITVKQLLEDKGEDLSLELISGKKSLRREIIKASVNRPGLALDGHLENYRAEIVQIIGRGEYAFCANLSSAKLKTNFLKMLATDSVPCVIVTAGMRVLPGIAAACKQRHVPLLTTSMDTASFVSELIAYLDDLLAPRAHLHGVLIKVSGMGVLIRGDAGIGKSECALELIKRGHILVADDVVEVRRMHGGRLAGSCPPMLRHYMEVRGLGILDIELLFGVGSSADSTSIEMEVNLVSPTDGFIERLGIEQQTAEILGVHVNSLTIPVTPGRNLAVLIEVAALNQRLKGHGIVSAKEFNKKLLAKMKGCKNGSE
ncbi:MAG: HPr(Ser) kinase/phosphatase [Elusimicrobiota bacterium]|jgi:HPr kinase/phosphorylase|nr:HPr(Ser) kinase/phosphatase [Elusimicrobiota bacterium]